MKEEVGSVPEGNKTKHKTVSVSLEVGEVDMLETLHLEFLAKEGGRQFAGGRRTGLRRQHGPV